MRNSSYQSLIGVHEWLPLPALAVGRSVFSKDPPPLPMSSGLMMWSTTITLSADSTRRYRYLEQLPVVFEITPHSAPRDVIRESFQMRHRLPANNDRMPSINQTGDRLCDSEVSPPGSSEPWRPSAHSRGSERAPLRCLDSRHADSVISSPESCTVQVWFSYDRTEVRLRFVENRADSQPEALGTSVKQTISW